MVSVAVRMWWVHFVDEGAAWLVMCTGSSLHKDRRDLHMNYWPQARNCRPVAARRVL